MRTRAFWCIALGHSFALLVISAVQVHTVAHLNEGLGYSLGKAALIVSLMTGMQMAGQLAGGFIGDRFNKQMVTASCMALHMIALLILAYTSLLSLIILFAVMHGMAMGIRGPLLQAMRADYFGRSAFGMIVGMSTLVTMFGNVLGPLIAGILADSTGSYKTGFTVLALLAGAGSVFFLFATPPTPPEADSGEDGAGWDGGCADQRGPEGCCGNPRRTLFRGTLFGEDRTDAVAALLKTRKAEVLWLGTNPNVPKSLAQILAPESGETDFPDFLKQRRLASTLLVNGAAANRLQIGTQLTTPKELGCHE